jgi:protein-tyrosine kinase
LGGTRDIETIFRAMRGLQGGTRADELQPTPPAEAKSSDPVNETFLSGTASVLSISARERRLAPDERRPQLRADSADLGTNRLRIAIAPGFEELKVNFVARHADEAMKTVLFVGTARCAGASTAAFNFATTLAEDPQTKVLLVNADLRAPGPRDFAEDTLTGSLAALSGRNRATNLPRPARQGNLDVLPSGAEPGEPVGMFQSKIFQQFLRYMRERYDYVILDGPPIDSSPESIALSGSVDGVILVIESEKTRKRMALWAKKRIEDAGGKVLGAVLNKRVFYIPTWLYKRI